MKKFDIHVDQEITYNVYGIVTKEPNVQLTVDDCLVSGITEKNIAIGYALGAFDVSNYTDVFVCQVTKTLNSWSAEEAVVKEDIIWSCSSVHTSEDTDEEVEDDQDEIDDEIDDVTNEVLE